MSFGKQTPAESGLADNQSPSAKRPRKKFPWLRGGIICIVVGLVNVIYFSQTGKVLLGPRSRGAPTPAFDVVISVLIMVFGVVAVFIHFNKNGD